MVEEFSAKYSPAKSGMRSDEGMMKWQMEGCNDMVGLSGWPEGPLAFFVTTSQHLT